MPVRYFPSVAGIAKWGNIAGDIDDQIDLKNALLSKSDSGHNHDSDYSPLSHAGDTDNPHSVSKEQVGLGNLSNDAQLKLAAGDFNTFDEKSGPDDNDILLIEDSENGYAKKKMKFTSLPSGSGSSVIWVPLSGTRQSASTFSFSGTSADAAMMGDSLLTCTNSAGTVRRIGFVKSASESSGLVTVNIITDSDLDTGDKDFKVALQRKARDYEYLISIPGELVADASNPQGLWIAGIKSDSYLLPVDSFLQTAASGDGASCAWNIYKGSTAMFASAQEMGTNSSYAERRPDTLSISAGDTVTMRVTAIGGDSAKPAGLQIRLYIVPQNIFTAF